MSADTIDITWGAVTLAHEGPYRVADISGWEDLPGGRVVDVARPNSHGSFDAPVWSSARLVTAEGYCISPETRDQLLIDLAAGMTLGGGSTPAELAVTFSGRTLTANARLTRSSRTLKFWGVGHFGWIVEWWAADCFRYGATVTTSTGMPEDLGGMEFPLFDGDNLLNFGALAVPGSVTLVNHGTAPAWPRFTITGPVPTGFELRDVETGSRIRWSGTIPDGIQVVIDSRTGTASYDGAPGYAGNVVRRQWWSVPPGGESTVMFVGLGTHDPDALMTASLTSTYW